METKTLKLSEIRLDGGTQIRDHTDSQVVEDYAQAMSDGAQFPAVQAVFDGAKYYLTDGFHRFFATISLHPEGTIEAEVIAGTRKDAIKLALGANAKHGLKRSNADKARAVQIALKEFSTLSAREIARICGVSPGTVDNYRTAKPAVVVGANGVSQPTVKAEVPKLGTSEDRGQMDQTELKQKKEEIETTIRALESEGTEEANEQATSLKTNLSVITETLEPEKTEANKIDEAELILVRTGDAIAISYWYKQFAALEKSFAAKVKQDRTVLESAADSIIKEGKADRETMALLKAMAAYWAKLRDFVMKHG